MVTRNRPGPRAIAAVLCLFLLGACGSVNRLQDKRNIGVELGRTATDYLQRGCFHRAEFSFSEALTYSRSLDDSEGVMKNLLGLGSARLGLGNMEGAAEAAAQALALSSTTARRGWHSDALSLLGSIRMAMADMDGAKKNFTEAAAIDRDTQDALRLALRLNNLGVIAHRAGDPGGADVFFTEALSLVENGGPSMLRASILSNRASLLLKKGISQKAREGFEQALEDDRQSGSTAHMAEALRGLGQVAEKEGKWDDARGYYLRALGINRQLRSADKAMMDLDSLIRVAGSLQDAPLADRYSREKDELQATPLPPAEICP